MANPWSISNRGNAGAAATATLTAPTSLKGQGMVPRVRALQCRLAGTAAGTDQLVIRDGASGVGAIIWTVDLAVPANGGDQVALTGLDIRGVTLGNSLTVEFVNGVTTDRETVNAQGDFVPQGFPMYLTPA